MKVTEATCTFEKGYVARVLRCPNCDLEALVEGHPDDVPAPGDACDCGGILEATATGGTVTITGIDRNGGTITCSQKDPK